MSQAVIRWAAGPVIRARTRDVFHSYEALAVGEAGLLGEVIQLDGDDNGLLEGEQYNTLDAAWFGPMAWISSFYMAALLAGEAMAREVGDNAFAERCGRIAERGSSEIVRRLYNGEYFIHKPDPNHPKATNTYEGCHLDQLTGQAWALQVGLPRVIGVKETRSALEAIWKYNFTPGARAVLLGNQAILAVLDLRQAMARFATEIDAVIPQLADTPQLELAEARHPLLALRHGVPWCRSACACRQRTGP